MSVYREIIEQLLKHENKNYKTVEKIVKKVCKKHGLKEMPTNIQILQACSVKEKEILKDILITKPTRTLSGVTIITVVAKPSACPGKCIYCPKGESAPQSYTGLEPAVQRAIRNDYDPFLQVKDRLKQFKLMGHPRDKIEIIILGGTFLASSQKYQDNFIKKIFDSLNGKESKNLKEAQKINETAKHRCVGLTIETRADYCFEEHINQMLRLGTTRVEIGLQSVYEDVLRKINRGHSVEDAIKATRLAKDSCLKVTYHIMPGLPGVSLRKDLEQFKILFENQDFKPDSLKIYPTLVIKGTELYDMWRRREYEPLTNKKTIKLLLQAEKYIPKYCRLIRLQRDISAKKIDAGPWKSNLRELIEQKAEKEGIRIQEIRYREVGHKLLRGIKPDPKHIKLCRFDYDASQGKEIFLSFEDVKNDILIGFIRLRIPFKPFRPEITYKTALIRELHVYGPAVPIGKRAVKEWQHKGFGKRLLEKAEKIAKEEFDKNKMIILSGIGVRDYYRKFDYKLDGPFVSKIL